LDDYAEAIKTHIRITGQKQLAAMEQRSDVLTELEPLVRNASEKRAMARQAFKGHVSTHQKSGTSIKVGDGIAG